MRDLNWFDPGSPLKADEISTAEAKLGVSFPPDYVKIVKLNSGASNPNRSEFEYYDNDFRKIGNFGILLSLSASSKESVFTTLDNLSDQLPPRVIPIVSTGSGDCVCLDYRGGSIPKVVYFAHGHSGEQSLLPLEDSFFDFVDKLQEPDDDE